MRIPLLDLSAQLKTLEKEIKTAVNDVIDSTRYIMGPKVTELEERIAGYVGARHGVGVSSGTDALLVSLMALSVGPGDIVVTTPYSFFATAGVIARLSAVPVFVDIDPDTYNLDPSALRRWFQTETGRRDRVKAIIPVHLYGQCADMDPILDIAEEFGVPVIEDAAQAIGAGYPSRKGLRKAGTMGTVGCFSFFPSKNLGGIGDGGMVVTDDTELAGKLACLRNHGMDPKYYHRMVGGNFRLDPIQASVLLVKLPHLEKWHAMRRENAAYYDANLDIPGLKKPAVAYQRSHHIYNQYVVSLPERRNELREFLQANEIGHEVYYPVPFHEQECFAGLGYRHGDFPDSECAAEHTIALPIYPELTRDMQDYVIGKIARFYE
jgi:dTDP-4-amino-4,6-dideoxygalactose transaminase